MIAFKTYSQAPEAQRLPGIPLGWPWQQMIIASDRQEHWEEKGFTVLSDEGFAAYLADLQDDYDAWSAEYFAPEVPKSVSPRQLRLALIQSGISMAQVDAAIDQLPVEVRDAARVSWEYSTEFDRAHPMLAYAETALSMTHEDVDALFMLASAL